jgi:hypothetical protein
MSRLHRPRGQDLPTRGRRAGRTARGWRACRAPSRSAAGATGSGCRFRRFGGLVVKVSRGSAWRHRSGAPRQRQSVYAVSWPTQHRMCERARRCCALSRPGARRGGGGPGMLWPGPGAAAEDGPGLSGMNRFPPLLAPPLSGVSRLKAWGAAAEFRLPSLASRDLASARSGGRVLVSGLRGSVSGRPRQRAASGERESGRAGERESGRAGGRERRLLRQRL